MLQIKSNADIDRDRAKAEAEKLEIEKDEKVDLSLSDYIWQCWKAAVDAKRDVEEQLLVNKRQIMGIYEADKLAAIKALKVPEIFMLITDVKCSNAAAWVEEILFQPNSLPWDIRPTPIPDLPQEIVSDILQSIISNYVTLSMQSMGTPFADPTQVHEFIASNMDAIKDEVRVKILEYAKKTSDRMRDKINDQLVEGNWYKALADAIPNIILKTGFLKGPVYRKRKGRVPKINPDTGAMYLAYEEKVVNWYESVSPFNIYPAPNAVGFDDGFLIERLQLTPIRLQELLGVEGYRDDEIRAVLREHGNGELANWINTSDVPDEELEDLTNRDSDGTIALYDSDKIDCLEYWGAVQGSKLIEYGMSSADIPDEDIYYHCCCWMIGKHVIKAMLNEDINGVKPYYKASFRDDKDSFWGRGLPEVIPDVQQGANAMARAILTNAAISSGPVVERNIDRIRPEDRADDTLYPLKMFDSTNEDMLTQAKAYEFYQPTFIADRLIVVFDKFIRLADEHSGVPAYATGDPRVGGAGRTATGLTILMSGAARGIKSVIKSMDDNMIAPSVKAQYMLNIEDFENYGLVCDFQVEARGSVAMLAKEQQAVRKTELLSMTANPLDAQIIGMGGRKYMLRDALKALDMDVDNILPDEPMSDEKLKEMQMIQQLTTNANAPGQATLDSTGAMAQGGDTQTVPSGAYGRVR